MLRIKNLCFSYVPNSSYLLNDINLSVNSGDYISILGDNGSGKSTLIKLILGLLKPSKGSVKTSFRRTAYLPQRLDTLNTQFPITVGEVLECYCRSIGIKEHSCVKSCLKQVHMEKYEDKLVGSLSGGQCQKVFIARALIGDPDILILDEPSNGVDPSSRGEIYKIICDINRTLKVTVISVEHNLKAAVNNSSLIYHLAGGNGHLCSPESYLREYLHQNSAENIDV